MSKTIAMLFLGLLASAVLAGRSNLMQLDANHVAHCGNCEGDEDHDHGDSEEVTLAHCGNCEGDEDHDHGDSEEVTLAHCGNCEGDEDHDHGDEESLV